MTAKGATKPPPWVQVWDESFDRVTDEPAMYKAGFRVRAGYAGGGSSKKWLTAANIKAWFAQGPDTAIAPLFEIAGTEPIDNPASGVAHGRAARAAWRALGVPDSVAIAYAVDENVTMAQARDQLLRYFHNIHTGDGRTGIAYVELDAGAYLFSHGATAGTFTPAAFSWDPSNKLVTPANAPAHVLWTQERNGRKLAGGTIDAGHIRTSAPVWWKTPTPKPAPEDDVELSDKITFVNKPDVKYSAPSTTGEGVLASTNYYVLQARNQINNKLDQVIDLLGDSAKVEAAISAALATLPTGVQVTAAALQAALLGALKELAGGDEPPAI